MRFDVSPIGISGLSFLMLAGCFSPTAGTTETEITGAESESTAMGSTGGSAAQTATETSASSTESPETTSANDTGETTTADTTTGTSSTETGVQMECGNQVIEGGEECDDGEATPTCSATCSACEKPPEETIVDQSVGRCLPNSYPDCGDTWSMANGQSNIQAFQVDNAGILDSVSIYALNEAVASSVITVQILDGGANALLPSGLTSAELASSVVGEATAAGEVSYSWVDFDLSGEGIEVVPGDNYFIWVRLLPPLPSNSQQRIRWDRYGANTGTDVYPEGRAFFCPAGVECDALAPAWKFPFSASVTLAPPLCE